MFEPQIPGPPRVCTTWWGYMCSIISGLLMLGIVGLCLYRLYLHRLAKHPGPLLARLTTIYGAYHGWKGDFGKHIWQLHQQYGDRVRWNPDYIMFNTAQAFQDIYGHGSKTLKAKNYVVLAQRAPSILTIRDPKQHRARKNRVAQALSDENIRWLEPGMQKHISSFLDEIGDKPGVWSPVRNMAKWCNYLLFDMMMSMVFGNPLKLLTEDTYRGIPDAIHMASRRQSMYIQSMTLAVLAWLRVDEPLLRKSVEARNTFVGFLKTVLKDRYKRSLAETEPSHDVYSFLKAEPKKPGAGELTPGELNAECATMIIAGSDTTATSLAAALFYLGRYRSAYNRCAAEVRSRFHSTSEIRLGGTLSSCGYLKACIQEALRLSPPVGVPLPREVPQGGAMIDGVFIPGGCLVGVGIYSIQHKQEHFSDPFTFRPERWLPDFDGAKDIVNHNTHAYGPFQIGPRGCVGKAVAMQELMLSLAHTFFAMDFEAVSPDGRPIVIERPVNEPIPGWNEMPIQEFITAQSDGPHLRFCRRDVT